MYYAFITVRKRSCGKVMFLHLSVSHSVHRGGCLPQCMLGYTPRQKPPWTDPPGQTHPLPSTCWDTLPCPVHAGIHPPPSTCWDRHGYCCGRYASYWNAFFSYLCFIFIDTKSGLMSTIVQFV